MSDLYVVAVVLALALVLLWSGWFMRAKAAWSREELLTERLEAHEKAHKQLQFEFDQFKKDVERYVDSRDERDRIRAVTSLDERIQRVLQLFPSRAAAAAQSGSQAPAPGDGGAVDPGGEMGRDGAVA